MSSISTASSCISENRLSLERNIPLALQRTGFRHYPGFSLPLKAWSCGSASASWAEVPGYPAALSGVIDPAAAWLEKIHLIESYRILSSVHISKGNSSICRLWAAVEMFPSVSLLQGLQKTELTDRSSERFSQPDQIHTSTWVRAAAGGGVVTWPSPSSYIPSARKLDYN